MRVVSTAIGYANPWITVREDSVVYANGETGMFGVVVKPDFAIVVPVENDGFWMVEQWRHTIQRRSWEFPAGTFPIDYAGDRGDMEAMARAELREESGFTAGTLTLLGRLAANVGLVANYMNVYLAADLVAGEPTPEPSESGMTHAFVTRADFRAMVRDGRCVDSHSIAAVGLLDLHEAGR